MKTSGKQSIISTLCMFIFVCVVSATFCHAEIPKTINYQGYLTDVNGDPLTDWVKLTLSLYGSESDSVPLWSETHDVFVQDGLFSVLLGSVSPLNLAFDSPYYLGVAVGEDPEMSPRYPLSSAAYALTSNIGGMPGPQGEMGPAGPKGPQGEKGDAGPQGPQGEKGEKGDTGARGLQGDKGDQGDPGPRGYQGDTGATGPAGPQGETGLQGPPGMTWQGTWQAGVEYFTDDAVSHNGSSYICRTNHTASDDNTPPDTNTWDIIALKGNTGAVGPQGEKGDTGPQGLKGDTGPEGPQGEQGPQGFQGPAGATGPQGPEGPTGPQGEQGIQGECTCPITEEEINSLIERLIFLESLIPRFTDMGNGTIRDNSTRLIWLKDAATMGNASWSDAMAAVAVLSSGEHGLTDGSSDGDWRLPTIKEWKAFVDKRYIGPALCNTVGNAQWAQNDAFINVQGSHTSAYWSGTSGSVGGYDVAEGIYMEDGNTTLFVITLNTLSIWPVRSGD